MKKILGLVGAVILAGALSASADETYKIDSVHSSISFKVRHFFSYVTGDFKRFEGTIHVDMDHPEKSSVSATIDVASIDTKNDKRDEDLRSPDFFEVAKYPTITFKSKSVKKTGTESGDIVGNLTMHGVTKEITLHAKFLGKGKGMGGKAISGWQVTADPIKRADYGLNWSKAVEGTAVVGEEVTISIDVEADKAP
ncbi:MAG TPA: YceI family protein [Chthoniobacterales bacterium]|jgi:polyisoprenoid-binding protein YceI